MSIEIDLSEYEIKEPLVSRGGRGRVSVKGYLTHPFIKGPVPLSWIIKASTLGKCALMVGLVLWYMDGMRGQKTFRLGRRDIAKLLGIGRLTVLRGIQRLEANGLIFVLREPGRKLVVTMNREHFKGGDNHE